MFNNYNAGGNRGRRRTAGFNIDPDDRNLNANDRAILDAAAESAIISQAQKDEDGLHEETKTNVQKMHPKPKKPG